MVVLGISVGSRQSGIAILEHQELVIWQILHINNSNNIHQKTLEHYILQYNINHVVIKTPPSTHITSQLNTVLQSFLKIINQYKCSIEIKTYKHIKQSMPSIRNKEALINYTCEKYPDLLQIKANRNPNEDRYYLRLFEAVIAAHQFQLSQSKSN